MAQENKIARKGEEKKTEEQDYDINMDRSATPWEKKQPIQWGGTPSDVEHKARYRPC